MNMSQLYQCPNCRLIPRSRVFQCSMGHVICEECLGRHSECPQCGIAFGKEPIRNLQVEAIIESKSDALEFACLYHLKGCPKRALRSEILRHEERGCRFEPTACPVCSTRVPLALLEDHLLAEHRSAVAAASPLVAGGLDEVVLDLRDAGAGANVHFTVHALERKFLVSIKKLDSLNAHFLWARLLDRDSLAYQDCAPTDHAPKPAYKAAFSLVNDAVHPTAGAVAAVHALSATVTDVVRTRQAMVLTRDLEEMYAVAAEPSGTGGSNGNKSPVVRVQVTFYNNLI